MDASRENQDMDMARNVRRSYRRMLLMRVTNAKYVRHCRMQQAMRDGWCLCAILPASQNSPIQPGSQTHCRRSWSYDPWLEHSSRQTVPFDCMAWLQSVPTKPLKHLHMPSRQMPWLEQLATIHSTIMGWGIHENGKGRRGKWIRTKQNKHNH